MKTKDKKSERELKTWNKTFRRIKENDEKNFVCLYANPYENFAPDCSINAICAITNQCWEEIYLELVCHTIVNKTFIMAAAVENIISYLQTRFGNVITGSGKYLKIVSDYTGNGYDNERRVYAQESLNEFREHYAKPASSYILITGVGEPESHDGLNRSYGSHATCIINGKIVDRVSDFNDFTVQEFIEIPTNKTESTKPLYEKYWKELSVFMKHNR